MYNVFISIQIYIEGSLQMSSLINNAVESEKCDESLIQEHQIRNQKVPEFQKLQPQQQLYKKLFLKEFTRNLTCLYQIELNQIYYSLQIKLHLMNSVGLKILIKNLNNVSLLYRVFNRLQNLNPLIKFVINPSNGSFYFSIGYSFIQIKKIKTEFNKYIKLSIKDLQNMLNKHGNQILKYCGYPQNILFQHHIKLELNFELGQKFLFKKPLENLELTDIQSFFSKQKNQSNSRQIVEILKNYQRFPIVTMNNQLQRNNIYNNITFHEYQKIKWNELQKSSNFLIRRAKVKKTYHTNQNPRDYIEQIMVCKTPISSSNQLQHQKKILSLLKNQSCAYLLRYYQVNHAQFKQSLFMDFLSFRSCEEYIRNTKSTLSIFTKLYLVCQMIQALRFLQSKQVLHMNLRLSNMMIGKGLVLRLCNFGKAYNKQVCKQKYQPSLTLPYSAPQIFNNKFKNFNVKQDIYSLGIIMSQIFFQEISIEYINQEKLIKQYRQKQSRSYDFFNIEKRLIYEPKQLSYLLSWIIYKCTSKNQQERPSLIRLLYSFRQILDIMESFV